MREPTELEKAYFAGMTDGDGYVTIHRSRKDYPDNIRVVMGKKDATVPVMAKDIWEGSVYHSKQGMWIWDIKALKARRFLEDIAPYIKIKKEQVELALEFFEIKSTLNLKERMEYLMKMSELHQRKGFSIKEVNYN